MGLNGSKKERAIERTSHRKDSAAVFTDGTGRLFWGEKESAGRKIKT